MQEIPLIGNPYYITKEKASKILDCMCDGLQLDRSKTTMQTNMDGSINIYFIKKNRQHIINIICR